MALAHNGIIRGLNSIQLQAMHLPVQDHTIVQDFLIYCQCWCESMEHHHHAEEQEFFPNIERISGQEGIMDRNVQQHQEFAPGFLAFQEYSRSCKPREYSGMTLVECLRDFAPALIRHLHNEIDTLLALDVYDSEALRLAYKRFERQLMSTDKVSFRMALRPRLTRPVPHSATCVWDCRQNLRERYA